MVVFRLTSDVYRAIVDHSRAMMPAEAVGLLGGPESNYATISIPLPNLAGQFAFFADPFAQYKAERRLAQLKLQLVAVYHSHPNGGTQLSQLDMIFARKRTCFQVIIALKHPNLLDGEMQAFRMVENSPVGVELCIVSRG